MREGGGAEVSHDANNERRRWPRIPTSALGNLSASIVAGPAVKLINLSRGGALLEVGARFPLRSSIRLKLTPPDGEVIVAEGRVAWAKVAAIVNGQVNYRVAIVFNSPIPEFALDTPAHQEPQDDVPASPEAEGPPTTVPVRDNLTRFPSVGSAERANGGDDRRAAGADSAPADDLRKQLAALTENLAKSSAANEALTAKLQESEGLIAALRRERETEQRQWDEKRTSLGHELANALARADALQSRLQEREKEQARLVREQREQEEGRVALRRQLADALARADALQSALEGREQEQARIVSEQEEQRATLGRQLADALARVDALQSKLGAQEQEQAAALREQQEKYERLVAELVQAANDQQTEYQHMLEQLTSAQEEQRRRAERHEAELTQVRADAHQQRAEAESRQRDLEGRLRAAEALNAAHDARDDELRQRTESLLSLIVSPVAARPSESVGSEPPGNAKGAEKEAVA